MAPSRNQDREAREARERLRRYNARQAVHQHQVKRRRRDNLIAIAGVIVVAALATVTQIFYFSAGPGKPSAAASASPSPSASAKTGANVGDIPSPSVAEHRTWTGSLSLNEVKLGISLDGAAAPQAVAVFVESIKNDYYVGKTCHRLVESDTAGLIQCGSVDGTGATETNFSYGPIENAPSNGVYPTGTIAIARASDNAYSQGHQFFIVFKDAQLPNDTAGGYTVIGTVTSGLDQLESQITDAGVTGGSQDGAPVTATTITAATIK